MCFPTLLKVYHHSKLSIRPTTSISTYGRAWMMSHTPSKVGPDVNTIFSDSGKQRTRRALEVVDAVVV